MDALIGDLAHKVRIVDLCRLVVERKAYLGRLVGDAVKGPHEVEMPGLAAELAVCDHAEACLLLLRDKVSYALVFYGLELFCGDLSCLPGIVRVVEPLWPQEASDDVEAVRGLPVICNAHGCLHQGLLSDGCIIPSIGAI